MAERRVFGITGAGSGIGRALAIAAVQRGVDVLLIGRSVAHLEATDDAIAQAVAACEGPVGKAYLYPLDLVTARTADYQQLAQTVGEQWGALHALIHQAGILGQYSPMAQYPLHVWHEVMHVNLHAPVALTQTLWSLLQAGAQQGGAQVLVSCLATDVARQPFQGAFGVAKIAWEAVAQIWAAEQVGSRNPVPQFHTVVLEKPVRTPFRLQGYPGETNQLWPEAALDPFWAHLFPADRPDAAGSPTNPC